ncbi:MAG: endonuclease V [Myxococcota bacterium]
MLLATDVAYAVEHEKASSPWAARAAGILFAEWTSDQPADTMVEVFDRVSPYVPGQFFRRELPCIWPLVERAFRRGPLTTVIIDGFVDLAPGRPGLGRHLFERLNAADAAVAVVGVAKNPFRGAKSTPVHRGDSKVPLWVTSAGISQEAASAAVASMHGPYRFPTLLRQVDQLTRTDPAL